MLRDAPVSMSDPSLQLEWTVARRLLAGDSQDVIGGQNLTRQRHFSAQAANDVEALYSTLS